MKRSRSRSGGIRTRINDIMRAPDEMICHCGFVLRPFARWSSAEFKARTDAGAIVEARIGWDYHGVFAPHSRLRAEETPAGRGVRAVTPPTADPGSRPPPRHVGMNWARRLKQVFGVEIERGTGCGGRLAIVASVEAPAVIAKILAHLERTAPEQQTRWSGDRGQVPQECRALVSRP